MLVCCAIRHAPTSTRCTGFCAIWVCIRSSSSFFGARGSQKTFGPKTQENQIGTRTEYFCYKETVNALEHIYVLLPYQKTGTAPFLWSFLSLFLEWLSNKTAGREELA